MDKNFTKQRFFMVRELRLSIALIVIFSLLAGILFTYITKEIGERIGHSFFLVVIVFLGYAIIVIVFATFFAHRFIGPFDRLKMELRLILAGHYHRRLCIRNSDDFYIRSFIADVNKVLDKYENECINKTEFFRIFDSELLHIISLIEKEGVSREELRESIISLHGKIKSLLNAV